MDIDEVRACKAKAEEKIADIVRGFVSETGCKVNEIYLDKSVRNMTGEAVIGMYTTELMVEI